MREHRHPESPGEMSGDRYCILCNLRYVLHADAESEIC